MVGTLVNVGAILVGSLAGVLIHSRLPKKMVDVVFQGIGLITITIGVSMALRSDNLIIAVMSIVLGAIIGQWIDLDMYLRRFAKYVQDCLARNKKGAKAGRSAEDRGTGSPVEDAKAGSLTEDAEALSPNRFSEGFVTSSMLFCVGSMAILGSMEEGMGQMPNLLFTKSIMDGFTSIALAATFGISIFFSTIPVLVYQGLLTLFASFIMRFMSESMIADMTSVGGIMLIGLGLTILKVKEINVVNMLPALVVAVVLSYFWQ